MSKLSPAQQRVLDELRKPGVHAIYMPYMGRLTPEPYWFLTSTHQKCTKQIEALAKLGLVETITRDRWGSDRIAIIKES